MTYSPDARARLTDRLRDLFPDACEFEFGTARADYLDDGCELLGMVVTFPEASFDDLPNGLCTPGAELARTLTSLGWVADAADGDPVVDDVPVVEFNPPRPESPVRLHELWQVVVTAFDATPDAERDLEVKLTRR